MIDERKRMFADWVSPFHANGFLSNFKTPDVPNLEVELTELVEIVGPKLPNVPQERMGEFLSRLGRKVRERAKHRGWPLPSEFVSAISEISGASKPIPPEHRILPASEPVNRVQADRAAAIIREVLGR